MHSYTVLYCSVYSLHAQDWLIWTWINYWNITLTHPKHQLTDLHYQYHQPTDLQYQYHLYLRLHLTLYVQMQRVYYGLLMNMPCDAIYI